MNKPVVNFYGQPVVPGQFIVISTTSGKWTRTRFAKVIGMGNGGGVKVVLTHKASQWDPVNRKYVSLGIQPYIKTVYGFSTSVPADVAMIPPDQFEALNRKG